MQPIQRDTDGAHSGQLSDRMIENFPSPKERSAIERTRHPKQDAYVELFNSRLRENSHGPVHHWALGVGHVADKIQKVARLLGIELIRVC